MTDQPAAPVAAGETEPTHRFLKLEYGGTSYVVPVDQGETILDQMSSAEPGDAYTLTLVEMTEAEYAALGEFDGF